MEDEKRKRARGANFSTGEKMLLFNLAYKYRGIIEDKRTDGSSLQEKKKAWEQLSDEFNAACPNGQIRNPDSLRNFYKNKKKELRQATAEEKFNIKKTGGGPPIATKTDVSDDLLLSIMNEKTVYGLCNETDSDGLLSLSEGSAARDENTTLVYDLVLDVANSSGITEDITLGRDNTNLGQEHNYEKVQPSVQHIEKKQVEELSPDGKKQSPNTTVKEKVPSGDIQKRGTFDKTRRRPATVVKALTTSELSQKYNRLIDQRLQIADMQKKVLEDQHEESLLKRKLLDIQIKNEEKKLKMQQ